MQPATHTFRRIRPLLPVLGLAFLFACQAPSASSPPATATASRLTGTTPPPVVSTEPAFSPTPTPPRATPTPSAVPTTTPTATPSATPTKSCVPHEAARLYSDLAPGLIIFSGGGGETGYDYNQMVALDTRQGVFSPFLPDVIVGLIDDVYTSPDGRRLALLHYQYSGDHEQSALIITAADPATVAVIPFDRTEMVGLRGWLSDNQRLIFLAPFDYDLLPFERPDEFIIFDPDTGLQQPLTPTFPYTPDGFIVEYWGKIGSSVIYDPTLTRVVYLDDDQYLVLWNLHEGREVWRYYYPGYIGSDLPAPAWSPDGQKLAQAVRSVEPEAMSVPPHAPLELRITDNVGIVTHFVLPNYEFLSQYPRDMSWSPDGRYLVFYYTPPEEAPSIYYHPQLLLWDTATDTVIDYCLTATGPGVVWSPDSRQFIADVYDPAATGEPAFLNVVVDVDQRRVYELRDITAGPVAWLRMDD